MRRKISDLFSYSSYKSQLTFQETIKAIVSINNITSKYFDSKYHCIKIEAPLLYSKYSGYNDITEESAPPKNILLNKTATLTEISTGSRKWCQVIAYNYGIKLNQCLYASSTNLNCLAETSQGVPPSNKYLTLTFSINKKEDLYETHKNLVSLFFDYYLFLKKEITRLFFKTITTEKEQRKIVLISDLELSSRMNFINSLKGEFDDENTNLVIRKIPYNKDNSSLFFSNTSYDYDYFSRFYKLNKFTNYPIDIAEITISCNFTSIKKQSKNKSAEMSDYEKLLKENKLPRYGQIQINLSNLYLSLLNKIHNGEVNATTWDDETYNSIITNKIKIL